MELNPWSLFKMKSCNEITFTRKLKIFQICIFRKVLINSTDCFPSRYRGLVPHSQGSLRENPKFLQNFSFKNNTLKDKSWLILLFQIRHYNSGLELIYYFTKLYVFYKRKFPKVKSETEVSFVNEAPDALSRDKLDLSKLGS
jgi:hypothetical protein